MKSIIIGSGFGGIAAALRLKAKNHNVTLIEKNTDARVAFITRLGEALLPDEHTVLQEGDLVHVFAQEKKLAAIEKSLSKSPEGA